MRSLLTAILALLLATAAAVRADDPAAGDEWNARGRAAYDRGAFREALDLFKEAFRHAAQPRYLFNAAKACLRLGDPEAALHYEARYLAAAADAEDRAAVEAEMETLRRDLRGRGLVRLDVRSDPPGAAFTVDGEAHAEIATAPAERWLPPGERVVAAALEGRQGAAQTVTLLPDTDATVLLALPPVPPPPSFARITVDAPAGARISVGEQEAGAGEIVEVPAGVVTIRVALPGHQDWVDSVDAAPGEDLRITATPLPLRPPVGDGRGQRIAGWVTLAAGAAALTTGATLAGVGAARMRDANASYNHNHASADYVKAFGAGRDLFHGGVGTLAVGAAAAATGGLLLLLAPVH